MQRTILNGHYEIGREIGRGAAGIVYLGRDVRFDRPVAIKIFDNLLSANTLHRAQREAKALARIRHPNLVGIYSADKDESGRLALVVDYIDGVPLSQLLKEQSLDFEAACDLFAQLCSGLSAIHAAEIVHRDIKPNNLMVQLSANGRRLWIIDFGLAKLDDGSQQKLTGTGMLVGTPAYMSPEQFRTSDISMTSDLYSAATVLYEMLTGKKPYASETPFLVAHKQVNEAPPPVASHGRSIQNHTAIDSFFLRALDKNPELRFESAKEMSQAFIEAGRSGVQPEVRKLENVPFKTEKLVAKVLGLIVVMILAALVIGNVVPMFWGQKSEAGSLSLVRNHAEDLIHDKDHVGARKYLKEQIPKLEKLHFDDTDRPQMINIYLVYSKECTLGQNTAEDIENGITATQKALLLTTPKSKIVRDICGRLGRLHFLSGQYALSLEEYTKLQSLQGKNDDNQWGLEEKVAIGTCLQKLWLTDEAITKLEKWMPQEDDAFLMEKFKVQIRSLGRAYIDRQAYEKAIRQLKLVSEIPRIEERQIDAMEIAFCQAMLGKAKQSREWLTKAHSRDAENDRSLCIGELAEAINSWNANQKADAERFLAQAMARIADAQGSRKSHSNRLDRHIQFGLYRLSKVVAERLKSEKAITECVKRMDVILSELIPQGALVPRSRVSSPT